MRKPFLPLDVESNFKLPGREHNMWNISHQESEEKVKAEVIKWGKQKMYHLQEVK